MKHKVHGEAENAVDIFDKKTCVNQIKSFLFMCCVFSAHDDDTWTGAFAYIFS
jgi:hypothetical protein